MYPTYLYPTLVLCDLVPVLDHDGARDSAGERGLRGVREEILLELVHDVPLEIAYVNGDPRYCM